MRPSRSVSYLPVIAGLLIFVYQLAQSGQVQGHLEELELESRIFGNTRKVRIWLPDNYNDVDSQTSHYPVLYLNDGQDLFDADMTVYGTPEWQVDETLSSLIGDSAIEPIIVVGIDSAGRKGRAREYLPYPDEFLTPPEPSPLGKLYASFLELEVLPLVESKYRVRSGRDYRTLGGSSYGALIALHVALSRPNLFGRLLLESPSFYVDDDHVLNDAAQSTLSIDRVYLGVGTNELGLDDCGKHPGNSEAVEGVRRLSQILISGGMRTDQLHVVIEPCAVHSQSAWARRLPAALRFLYGDESGQVASSEQ
jgi:predicted alpha/beta superfamily hydrolase